MTGGIGEKRRRVTDINYGSGSGVEERGGAGPGAPLFRADEGRDPRCRPRAPALLAALFCTRRKGPSSCLVQLINLQSHPRHPPSGSFPSTAASVQGTQPRGALGGSHGTTGGEARGPPGNAAAAPAPRAAWPGGACAARGAARLGAERRWATGCADPAPAGAFGSIWG